MAFILYCWDLNHRSVWLGSIQVPDPLQTAMPQIEDVVQVQEEVPQVEDVPLGDELQEVPQVDASIHIEQELEETRSPCWVEMGKRWK